MSCGDSGDILGYVANDKPSKHNTLTKCWINVGPASQVAD